MALDRSYIDKSYTDREASLFKSLALVKLKNKDGYCFGFAHTALDLFLNNRLNELSLILKQIHHIPYEALETTIESIIEKRNRLVVSHYPDIEKTIREKHADASNEQLNLLISEEKLALEKKYLSKNERYILQIKPLLYSIKIHHEGYLLPNLFEEDKKPTLQDAEKTFSLMQSNQSPQDNIVRVKKWIGTYNRDDLAQSLSLLHQKFEQMPLKNQRVALTMSNGNHTFFIGYNIKENSWTFMDINPLRITKKRIDDNVQYIYFNPLQAVDVSIKQEETLVDIIHAACGNDSPLILSSHLYMKNILDRVKVNNAFSQLEESDQWKKLHAISWKKWGRKDSNGYSLLHLAVKEGFLETVQAILADPEFDAEDLNGVTKRNLTALYFATEFGFSNIVQLLLKDSRLDPNIASDDKITPLNWAVQENYVDIVKALITDTRTDPNIATIHGVTPFYKAIYYRNVVLVKLLLSNAKTNPNLTPPYSMPPLIFAISSGLDLQEYAIIFKKLLNDERTNINVKYFGQTCLYIAAKNGKTEIVEALLKNDRTDPNLTTDGESPIIAAARKDNVKIVNMLLADDRVDAEDCANAVDILLKNNNTPYIAAQSGSLTLLSVLLADNKLPINLRHEGVTLLFCAILFGHLNVVKFLLLNGAQKETAIIRSAGWLKAIAHLVFPAYEKSMEHFITQKIDQGESPLSISITPLELATILNHKEIINVLNINPSIQQSDYVSLAFFQPSIPRETEVRHAASKIIGNNLNSVNI